MSWTSKLKVKQCQSKAYLSCQIPTYSQHEDLDNSSPRLLNMIFCLEPSSSINLLLASSPSPSENILFIPTSSIPLI